MARREEDRLDFSERCEYSEKWSSDMAGRPADRLDSVSLWYAGLTSCTFYFLDIFSVL